MFNFLKRSEPEATPEQEQFIRECTALYRHYCIEEVQDCVEQFTHQPLDRQRAINTVQKIRNEYGMGPIDAHNLNREEEE